MGVNNKQGEAWAKKLAKANSEWSEFMNSVAVGEGRYAADKAREISTEDMSEPQQKKQSVVNTGLYRRSWNHDKTAVKNGTLYSVECFNNVEYASHLEYGFRSHFVPGKYLSGAVRTARPNGFYIGKPGGFVRGHFTLRRAVDDMKRSQEARIKRKVLQYLKNKDVGR